MPTLAIGGPTGHAHPPRRWPTPAGRTDGKSSTRSARFESRQWLASPWFGAGVGFCRPPAFLFGWVWAADYDGPVARVVRPHADHGPPDGRHGSGRGPPRCHPGPTRRRRGAVRDLPGRRDDPHDRPAAGQLGSGGRRRRLRRRRHGACSPVRNPRIYGPIDGRALADVLAARRPRLGGSALGVALARWAPWRLAPIVVVAALVPVILELGNLGDPHWSNARQLSHVAADIPTMTCCSPVPPVWWHLLWLGGARRARRLGRARSTPIGTRR